jgi:Domain of unknown function (DUF3303)
MKFLISWRVHDDQRQDVFAAFSEMTAEDDAADKGDVKLIGRWHDLVGFTGVAVCEADDLAPVANWILNWNAVLDAEVTPVLDDEEARAIGRARSQSD